MFNRSAGLTRVLCPRGATVQESITGMAVHRMRLSVCHEMLPPVQYRSCDEVSNPEIAFCTLSVLPTVAETAGRIGGRWEGGWRVSFHRLALEDHYTYSTRLLFYSKTTAFTVYVEIKYSVLNTSPSYTDQYYANTHTHTHTRSLDRRRYRTQCTRTATFPEQITCHRIRGAGLRISCSSGSRRYRDSGISS